MAGLNRIGAADVGFFRIRLEADQSIVIEFRTEPEGELVARVPLTREAADALAAAIAPDKRADMYKQALALSTKITH